MTKIQRRELLAGTVAATALTLTSRSASADVPAGRDPFTYEVQRTDAEWRELLGDSYPIMREGKTEKPFSNDTWAEAREGEYRCRGCDLVHYSSFTKVALAKGWLFFTASEPNSQLMSQDGPNVMADGNSPFDVTIEVHCRRCGSHTGHILKVDGRTLHCINGASLDFIEATA